MQLVHRMINQDLAKMRNIATPATANRAIGCIACHRGTSFRADAPSSSTRSIPRQAAEPVTFVFTLFFTPCFTVLFTS
jgi:hypothetical protein